jgi:phosphohistidine phosphatase
MLTLLLMRHGKSDWQMPFPHDRERPLAKRGRKAAARMGRFLSELGVAPERVLTSDAVRARETAALAAKAGGWSCAIEPVETFYEGSPEAVIQQLRQLLSVPQTLLLVGHEPTWSSLLSLLIGGGALRFPTAAVAALELDAPSWAQLEPGRCRLLWLVPPRLLEPDKAARKDD